jgi:hypothetical protein
MLRKKGKSVQEATNFLSGMSVGSDTHSLAQYDYGRLKAANEVEKC